ncbi:hypothetical protein PtA15_7A39 [Puccinia triticina]|uniref:Uncharacterized protein n=1 Tax=Puccinia triticina TaxID=208348 RepID=A0ABY7CN05_9BASI|nr:uncharacterized protein PtA15_7A39 [Puccinia triticina]WAQ86313.1 hypothetical protein PtA15_7A39 [Puccinia triticina]
MADSAMGFYQAQGDLVIERFTNLIDSYSPDGDEFPYDTCLDDTFSIERVNLKKNQLNQLQTNLLPLLSRQVTLLAGLLDPYILQSKPGSTFKLILGIQSDFIYPNR